jgi:hypothetical protein
VKLESPVAERVSPSGAAFANGTISFAGTIVIVYPV